MHYKQKNIPGLFWKELLPGQIALYVFNDPLKPHKLLVHAGKSILSQKRLEISSQQEHSIFISFEVKGAVVTGNYKE